MMLEVNINREVKRDIKEKMSKTGSKDALFYFFKIVLLFFKLFYHRLTWCFRTWKELLWFSFQLCNVSKHKRQPKLWCLGVCKNLRL